MNNLWGTWSVQEREFSEFAMKELADVGWVRPLLDKIIKGGGPTLENQSLQFELRFALALHQVSVSAEYEILGEGDSSIDFGFDSADQYWRVEMMQLNETQAVRDATHTRVTEDGVRMSSRSLSSNASDKRQSPEGETLKAVQRICQKCERNGVPHKFPKPDGGYHVILVDFREFQNGGDTEDQIHIGLGGEYVSDDVFRMYWKNELISGVFNTRTAVRGAREARERVHFLGFLSEKRFVDGGFARSLNFVANPNIFDEIGDIATALEKWPLRPKHLLNTRHDWHVMHRT